MQEEEIKLQWQESFDKVQLPPLTITGLRKEIPDCNGCSQFPFSHIHQLHYYQALGSLKRHLMTRTYSFSTYTVTFILGYLGF